MGQTYACMRRMPANLDPLPNYVCLDAHLFDFLLVITQVIFGYIGYWKLAYDYLKSFRRIFQLQNHYLFIKISFCV